MTAAQRNHIRAERNRLIRERLFVVYFDTRDNTMRVRRGATGARIQDNSEVGHIHMALTFQDHHIFDAHDNYEGKDHNEQASN